MIQMPEMTRRVFLNRTLQALGAVAAAPFAAGAAGPATGPVTSTATAAGIPALRFLSPEQYATLDAVTDTMIPRGGAFELGARDIGTAARIDSFLPKLDPVLAQGFRGALVFVEQQAPALAGKTMPFSGLSEEDRTAVFNALLQAGGLPAGIFTAMKFFSVSYFYTADATWKYTGYDGPMLLEDAQ